MDLLYTVPSVRNEINELKMKLKYDMCACVCVSSQSVNVEMAVAKKNLVQERYRFLFQILKIRVGRK